MSKEFTFSDVAEHTTKKDCFMIVHDKVYDTSSFVDEHPGGEEVLLDVGGQDASEASEDVGHSDEAREILNGLLVGTLKRGENDPPAPSAKPAGVSVPKNASDATGLGISVYALILFGGALAFFAYTYLYANKKSVQI
ncbi:hypothetical protein LTR95_015944 [Oleoguttula sp. CCFEE 5521]